MYLQEFIIIPNIDTALCIFYINNLCKYSCKIGQYCYLHIFRTVSDSSLINEFTVRLVGSDQISEAKQCLCLDGQPTKEYWYHQCHYLEAGNHKPPSKSLALKTSWGHHKSVVTVGKKEFMTEGKIKHVT